ncbi:hypothetical protein ACQKWADRAFT_311076 [Trichoderma austrokoningii]
MKKRPLALSAITCWSIAGYGFPQLWLYKANQGPGSLISYMHSFPTYQLI